MTKTENKMSILYRRLAKVGVERSYVKKQILPDWWEDKLAENPAGFAQGAAIVAQALGISIVSILSEKKKLVFMKPPQARFKTRKNLKTKSLALTHALTFSMAKIVSRAVAPKYSKVTGNALSLRKKMIGKASPCIDLAAMLDFCWASGIPVLHVNSFPKSSSKMDGVTFLAGKRPAIVLTLNHKYPAWHAFILAHELGHVALGHLGQDEGGFIDDNMKALEGSKPEQDATEFGSQLLCGHKTPRLHNEQIYSSETLLHNSKVLGKKMAVDPGFAILNHGWKFEDYATSMTAMKRFHGDADEARKQINDALNRNLNWEKLTESERDLVGRMTGISGR